MLTDGTKKICLTRQFYIDFNHCSVIECMEVNDVVVIEQVLSLTSAVANDSLSLVSYQVKQFVVPSLNREIHLSNNLH